MTGDRRLEPGRPAVQSVPDAADVIRQAVDVLRVTYVPVLGDPGEDAHTAVDISEPLADWLERCADAIAYCVEAGHGSDTPVIAELAVLVGRIRSVIA